MLIFWTISPHLTSFLTQLSLVNINYQKRLKFHKLLQLVTFDNLKSFHFVFCPVTWGCRIHWLPLCRGVRPPPTSVLDMTLNNLMVRFQWCWGFGECRVALHCHRSLVHTGLEWEHLIRVLSMGWIELTHGFLSILFFAFKQCIYAKLNCLKWNCFNIQTAYYAILNCLK